MKLELRPRTGRIPVTRPNWADPVSVQFQFMTEVLSSYHDYEQRQSMRVRPRISVNYTTALTAPMLRRWFTDMTSPNDTFWLPCEWRGVALSVDAPAGSLSISLDDLPVWVAVGSRLVLSDGKHDELVTVSALPGGNVVSLTGPTLLDISAPAKAYLALEAHVDNGIEFDQLTDSVSESDIRFEVVPGDQNYGIDDDGLTDYDGYPVLVTTPNWSQAPKVVTDFMRSTFDPGYGKKLVFSPIEKMKRILKLGYSRLNSADIDALLALFIDRRGKRGSFWCPTFVQDMVATATALSGQADVVVAGTEMMAYEDSDVHNVVIAYDTDGSWQANRIVSMTDDGTDTTLTFEDNWTFDILTTTTIHFLYRTRFATDIMEVQFVTDSVANIEVSVEPIRST